MSDIPVLLIVDDEQVIRESLVGWLTRAGHCCAQAESAEAAWRFLQSNEVALVTCDLNMPGRSGFDLLLQIRQQFPDTAVLMVTGSVDTKTAIQSLTSGAFGYIVKPVERQELLLQVQRGLERRNLILENREYMQTLERRVHEQTVSIRQAHEETIHRLVNAAMMRDEETGAHIRRIGLYCEAFAEVLGWTPDEIDNIRLAAPMHDVGKIGVPDRILCKPGKLTVAEYETMKTHTTIGASLLSGSDWPVLKLAQQIARYHHERWDGSGYPDGISGEQIPVAARILSIVDVYDALTHDRVYRSALSEADALEVMSKGNGTQFDAFLFSVFLALVPELRRMSLEYADEPSDDGNGQSCTVNTFTPVTAG
ncbi:MAG: HD domain-containing phosphohydrolase [Pirellulales bacterium]